MSHNLYFEDLHIGHKIRTDSYIVSAEEIISFATQYDPQPMHMDAEAAKHSIFGELVASGWHTLAITMRLMVLAKPLGDIPLVGLGGDEVRFLRPLRPNDVVHVEAEISDKRPASKPDRGHVEVSLKTFANDQIILTEKWRTLVPMRPQQ